MLLQSEFWELRGLVNSENAAFVFATGFDKGRTAQSIPTGYRA